VTEPRAVLVVEDDVLVRLTLAEILMDAGFSVTQAASADEALKILQAGGVPDLVITDIEMPGSLDGLQLAARLRDAWPGVRTLVVSGRLPWPPPRDTAEFYLVKPVRPDNLLAAVRYLLDAETDDQVQFVCR
jgi:two-component system, response regulator PdtaR